MKEMYVIDFDDTIFDTLGFKQYLFGLRGKQNFQELQANYDNIIQKYGYNNFQAWAKLSNLDYDKIYDEVREHLPSFVYEDFYDFAKQVNNNIIILSYGEQNHQEFKIKGSGVQDYVQKYIITSGPKYPILQEIYNQYKQDIIFIDDKKLLYTQGLNAPVQIFRIERNNQNSPINSLKYFLHH